MVALGDMPRGVKGDGTCGACGSGKCIEPRPLEVGQKVALVGQQTYFILGVIG